MRPDREAEFNIRYPKVPAMYTALDKYKIRYTQTWEISEISIQYAMG